MASLSALVGTLEEVDASYLGIVNEDTGVMLWFTKMLTWLLLCVSFVPISLYVTLEMVKFGQAYFMMQDVDMYDRESDT